MKFNIIHLGTNSSIMSYTIPNISKYSEVITSHNYGNSVLFIRGGSTHEFTSWALVTSGTAQRWGSAAVDFDWTTGKIDVSGQYASADWSANVSNCIVSIYYR